MSLAALRNVLLANIQIQKMGSVLSVQPTAERAMDQVITIVYHAI
jgi:hypothetical protein